MSTYGSRGAGGEASSPLEFHQMDAYADLSFLSIETVQKAISDA